MLEAYDDVFADIVNVLLFNGKEVVSENELEEAVPRSAYKIDGNCREIERDTAKRWIEGNIRLACIGLENQTNTDRDMPLRVLSYDAAEYRAQLNKDKKSSDPPSGTPDRYPVVTLVLYFDYRKRWDEPVNLIECLKVPEAFRPYINDYRVNLFDIAFLSDEQVKLFKSDFRFVADYFVQMRKTGTYMAGPEEIRHVQETLHLMSVMTQDRRFEEAVSNDGKTEGKEIKTMSEFLDRIEARGMEKGMEKGKAEGIIEGTANGKLMKAKEMAISLRKQGVALDTIANAAGVSEDVVREWIELQTA